MARPRTFDEERALDAAMHAFWANGYEATSTQDLCDATGLGRSSIYNTFSSKHELFRRALARYIDSMTSIQVEILEDAGRPPMDRLRALFARIVDSEFECRKDGHSIGCLTVNTTVELAGRDPEAAEMLARDLAMRLSAISAVIRAGQSGGDITSARDAADLARFVNAIIGGMRIAAQGGADRAALTAIAETALDALNR
ncbi:TetR/AcrR family transcriptional regulator [Streptomyces durmitorensis]|uniref:TetR/AcrR family transcriptional regulator n=1 Tax=Streptomyces durmitorensis TaxID=319947 RepID=A0ABY4Q4Z0_9ACTN|nr:TetR/AcrR family transcriptional regulator [Streptomyces durmitorensis]UQT60207.1 TetR/AcrR family transcriptional regulator [Streptomyces durmitorensis]